MTADRARGAGEVGWTTVEILYKAPPGLLQIIARSLFHIGNANPGMFFAHIRGNFANNHLKMKTQTVSSLLLAFIAVVLAPQASAGVVYTYQGQGFNLRNSTDPGYTYASTDSISFSFTLSNALSTGFTDLMGTVLPWSASDGKYSFGATSQVGQFGTDTFGSGLAVSVLAAQLTTDASGAVVAWSFDLFNGAHSSQLYSRSAQFPVGDALFFSQVNDYAYSRPDSSGAGLIEWGGSTAPGSWTVTNDGPGVSVPEPGTIILTLTGLGIFARSRSSRRNVRSLRSLPRTPV